MRTRRLVWVLLPVLALLAHGQVAVPSVGSGQDRGSITVDATKTGAKIPANLYGIFFEEISHAGDGGLYAELVQNRGFEDANLPPACTLDNGSIVPPRTPHFDTGRPNNWRLKWDVNSPYPAWSLQVSPGSEASMDITIGHPLSDATPHSLLVNVKKTASSGRIAVINDGYWGIGVKTGEDYKLSLWTWTERPWGPMFKPALETADGRTLTAEVRDWRVDNGPAGTPWRRLSTTLHATGTDPKARLVLTWDAPPMIFQLDMVSLFPATTFKNRPNGMRVDLAETIAALKPGFIRGPGGCFAEGITVQDRPQWKRSIGPIEQRPGTYSPWGYWSSDGFGYHEFLQFAEDIGADALYVVNVGVSCSFRSGTFLPDEDVPGLIQDTLDGIEYAIGPTTSKWGAERTKNGHPNPFPLKYIEVGNEQQGARYGERAAKFYAAIKAKYPQIHVVLSSWISGIDQKAIDAAGKIDLVDEHAYKPLHWSIQNFDSFAKYPRTPWDLYIGEFATNSGVGRGNLAAAIDDAAYMMSVEKNTDLVKMASYAPLLENVNKRDWEVNMIHFDSSRLFMRATYYVQKLFAENLPTVSLPVRIDYAPLAPRPIAGRVGVSTYNTAAEYKDIRVETGGKVVYLSDFSKDAAGWDISRGNGQMPAVVPSGTSSAGAPSGRGTWAVVDGAYRQSDQAVSWSYYGDAAWTNVTLSLKARKIAGAEGFIVSVGYADGRRVQNLPRIDTVLAIAGKDERTGDIIIKAINTSPEPASMTVAITGARVGGAGLTTVLTSANPTDENSFETPAKIVPVTTPLVGVGPRFTHVFPANSLTVIRLSGGR
jgi:alpha-L-arabinofuranosidase